MTTGIDVFDTTLQETGLWLKDLMGCLGSDDKQQAYRVLRAVLHAVRDRIGPDNAVHLGAQLPMLLRGLYYDGWRMHTESSRERHRPDFLLHVDTEAKGALGVDAEIAVHAVFETMTNRLDPGEVAKVINMFPEELRGFWPRGARTAS